MVNQQLLRKVGHLVALLAVASAVLVGALGVTPHAALAQDDELEANKALVAELYDEVVNNRNYEIILDMVAPGVIEHTRDGDEVYETAEDFMAATMEDVEGAPGLGVTVNYQVAEGEHVVNHLTYTVMDGAVSADGISIARVVDGMIVELEEILDEVAIEAQMAEMGMMEEPPGEGGIEALQYVAEGLNGPMGVLLDDVGNRWLPRMARRPT